MTNAGLVDLVLDQGTDWIVQLYWTDQYAVPFSVVPPIRMQVRDQLGQVVLERKFDTTTDGFGVQTILYNSATGLIQVLCSAEESADIAPGVYHYDLFSGYSDNTAEGGYRVSKIIQGRFIVEGRITRDL